MQKIRKIQWTNLSNWNVTDGPTDYFLKHKLHFVENCNLLKRKYPQLQNLKKKRTKKRRKLLTNCIIRKIIKILNPLFEKIPKNCHFSKYMKTFGNFDQTELVLPTKVLAPEVSSSRDSATCMHNRIFSLDIIIGWFLLFLVDWLFWILIFEWWVFNNELSFLSFKHSIPWYLSLKDHLD